MPQPVTDLISEPTPSSRDVRTSIRGRAIAYLLFATILWGVSFPLGKAVEIGQRQLLPEASSWFLAAYTLTFRFIIAAAVLALFAWRRRPGLTRLEFSQGVGLGFFGGLGILLQIDGLAFTQASTSAFLTASYCVFLPLFVALRQRALPSVRVMVCVVLVFAGMAILAGVDWKTLRMGRGEIETIIASFFFAGQILWLERPKFHDNRSQHASIVMFAVVALICAPVAWFTQQSGGDWITAGRAPAVLGYLAALTLLCTMLTFSLMNRWQKYVTATEAGLIYCAEPVSTSLMALFVPAWLAGMGGFTYLNETATWALIVGGTLITAANLLIQIRPVEQGHHPL